MNRRKMAAVSALMLNAAVYAAIGWHPLAVGWLGLAIATAYYDAHARR